VAYNFRASVLMRDVSLSHASPFYPYWRRAYYRHISHFIVKGGGLLVAHLILIGKRDALHMDASPFILSHPTRYRSLVAPLLLELILAIF
jgi:hypothetical protein